MVGRGIFKKRITCVFLMLFLCLSLFLYLPFCSFTQILTGYENEVEYKNGVKYPLSGLDCFMSALGRFTIRCSCYQYGLFLTKGSTYRNIPFHAEEDTTDVKFADIRFNWDNTISLNFGDEKIEFEVDKVEITPETYRDTTAVETVGHFILTSMDPPTSRDSLFNLIHFYDSSGNYFCIVRQTKAMVYGRQRVGFSFEMNGKYLKTGRNASSFDY